MHLLCNVWICGERLVKIQQEQLLINFLIYSCRIKRFCTPLTVLHPHYGFGLPSFLSVGHGKCVKIWHFFPLFNEREYNMIFVGLYCAISLCHSPSYAIQPNFKFSKCFNASCSMILVARSKSINSWPTSKPYSQLKWSFPKSIGS